MDTNKARRLHLMFLMPVLLTPVSLFAQSPFDGTWRINFDQSKLSQKPFIQSLSKGMYSCSSCNPKIEVKADGTDQPVMGQAYDAISVRAVDSRTIAGIYKKGGEVVSEQTRTVSNDGNTLTNKVTSHPPNGAQTLTSERSYTRVGNTPDVAHAVSGSWRGSGVKTSGGTSTFKSRGGELSFSDSDGCSYNAKLDGKDYPAKGGLIRLSSVSLKRIDDRTMEETDQADGKLIYFIRRTVAPDGTKMTEAVSNKLAGTDSTLVYEKQEL